MSELRVDNIVSEDGTAAPVYSKGMTIGAGQTLTCTGDFSVGGNVTFDSGATVTGVVTFSSADLQTNLSVSSLNSSGIVTASSFSGDGSNLTGIDSTALVDSGSTTRVQANTSGAVVTGILTATSFSGTGAISQIYYAEYSTRSAGSSVAGNQFVWSGTFTPNDPVNNKLWFNVWIPANGAGNDYSGQGIYLTDGGSNNYGYYGRGMAYGAGSATNSVFCGQSFVLPANTIAAADYTLSWRTETTSSHMEFYCPNNSDDGSNRLTSGTRATVTIVEFKP